MESAKTNNINVNNQLKSLTTYPPSDSQAVTLMHPYTQTVKEFMLTMIEAGYNYEDNSELCSMAMQATDKLIEKVNSKRNLQQ